MQKRIDIYALLAGLFFVCSSIAKAINANIFSEKISQYGFENFFFLSPIIILIEAIIGILLVLKIHQKQVALCGAIVVVFFTVVYTYGLFVRGISDCGCFGNISFLNSTPIVVFLRNTVLLVLLLIVWRKDKSETQQLNKKAIPVLVCFMGLIAFMSGYTLQTEKYGIKYKHVPVEEHAVNEYLKTSRDSTYMVFVFSYTCPHCVNSIANLNGYLTFGVVDHIVALGVGDSIQEDIFRKYFDLEVQIKTRTKKELFPLAKRFPTLYFIQHDTILFEYVGELPCSYIMKSWIDNF